MITHESCIAPLLARTHLIFYPDRSWGEGAGRYMWVDEQGRLLYFRYRGDLNEITEYKIDSDCTEDNIRKGFYGLEAEHLQELKEFSHLSILRELEKVFLQYESMRETIKDTSPLRCRIHCVIQAICENTSVSP